MKKISLLELIVIGVGTLAVCFTISKFVLCKFNMQTDFLSASATLFAATLAYKLFNDWRQQFKAEMIERLKDRLFTNFKNMEAIYSQLCVSVDQNRFGTPNDNDLLKTSLLAEKVNDNIDGQSKT